jgi:hypothetical protein
MYLYIYGLYYVDYMNYKPLTNDAHGLNPMIFSSIQMSTECYIPLSSDIPSTIDGVYIYIHIDIYTYVIL